jgi:hypothetical protein
MSETELGSEEENRAMSLGEAKRQERLFDEVGEYCASRLSESSVYAFLRREREHLFPDAEFADLYSSRGRRSVPPSVVATVMVLQRVEGCSDREAVERFAFDARWRYAAGVSGYTEGGCQDFVHTVLVDMRERLRRSARPDRIFEVTLRAAKEAGVVGRRRVLDSTALYDAVTTMDTVTLIRSAIRSLLSLADPELAKQLRSALSSGDDYASSAKPQIDWGDQGAREELIDSRARDASACLEHLEGQTLSPIMQEAVQLLATVVGQDLELGEDGKLRIARRVAQDRVISTVDPEARHGHKSPTRGFDGYKGHIAIDPDSELITTTRVTPGSASDGSLAAELVEDLTTESSHAEAEPATVYGDSAYGTGTFLTSLRDSGITSRCKTRLATAPADHYSKDRFTIDLEKGTVGCPAGNIVKILFAQKGGGEASFGALCSACSLRARCTSARAGRTIKFGPHEAVLVEARRLQGETSWRADYRATRPKVERKVGHLMRRRHGGRRARVRGQSKVDADFRLLAAAINAARLAVLGLRWHTGGWSLST